MKPYIFVLLALTVAMSTAKPIFTESQFKSTTADDIKNYIIAVFEGLDLVDKIKPTPEWLGSSDQALNFAVAGINNIQLKNYYEGALNISDSLGALSPLARQCDKALTDLATLIQGYPGQFSSVLDFFIKLGLNLLGNVKPLLDWINFSQIKFLCVKEGINPLRILLNFQPPIFLHFNNF